MAKNNSHGLDEMVLQIAAQDQVCLGKIRSFANLKAALSEGSIWVRGIDATTTLPSLIQQLPAIGRFYIDDQNRLFPTNGITPVHSLKELKWQTIQQFVPVESPSSAFPGKTTEKYQIQLVSSALERTSTALLTDWATWKNYVVTAPAIRLAKLKFALSAKNQVLILGQPLPSIPGKAYWQQDFLLLPTGFDFDLNNMAFLMEQQLNKAKNAYLLFLENGAFQRIPLEQFVLAQRSAVKLIEN